MGKVNWRENLSKELKYYMDRLILESFSQKRALDLAPEKGRAQLWVALALLNRRLTDIELKTAYLEKTMQRIFSKDKLPPPEERKKQAAEVEKLIKSLARGEILRSSGPSKVGEKKIGKRRVKKRRKVNIGSKGTIKIAKSL
ncbi:MAG: hypothetical protein K6T16_00990 [Candidatus Pacearchaeota archaeon]|nr:hypothetical protein [Candidatus Pacearchaeota archaeon]